MWLVKLIILSYGDFILYIPFLMSFMFFYFFCPFVQGTMEWEEFFVLFMNNEGPSVNNLPEVTLQNCEIIKTKIWVILSIISALIMNVICWALGHMLAVESERYRSGWILTLLLTSWGPLVNAWLHSLPGGASSKSPQVGFCCSLLWAACLGPAWPRKPHLFSPGCHIRWWFQVPLCRKDLGGVVGFLDDSHDFGDRRMGAQTWWVTLPGHISWGSMILNPGGFILMGVSALSPWCLTWTTCWLSVTFDRRRKGMVDVNPGSLHLSHHGSPERDHPAQRLSAWETGHQGASWPSKPDLPSRCSKLLQGFHGLSLAQLLTINIVIPESTQPLVKIMEDFFFFCHKQFWRN